MHGVEVGPCAVHPSQDKIGSDIALVVEQVLLQHSQSCDHTRLGGGGGGRRKRE